MLFSKALCASIPALLSLSSTFFPLAAQASPLSRSELAVYADIPALKPIANLISGLGLLTFQIDNFRRDDESARKEILESITDTQQLAKRLSYGALREDDVAHAPETTAAAKRLGEQLRALFGAIDERRIGSKSGAPKNSADAPADARPPGVLPPAQQPAGPPSQAQPPSQDGAAGDGIVEDIYSNAVSLLATIQDSLPEYFWVLVTAT